MRTRRPVRLASNGAGRNVALMASGLAWAMIPFSAVFAQRIETSPVVPAPAAVSPPSRPVPVGSPVPLSLVEAVALGLRENRDIRSAYLTRISQKFDLFVARGSFRPRIAIAGSFFGQSADGRIAADATVTPSLRLRTTSGATIDFVWDRRERLRPGPRVAADTTALTISQPLLRGGGFDVNLSPLRVARLQEQINQLNLKSTVSNIVATIITGYRDLVQAQEQVRLAEISLERTRALLDTNHALIKAGRMAAADIVQTESQVANQEVALLQAQQQKITAQLVLIRLLAVDSRTNIVAADEIRAEHVPIDLARVVDLGLASRMDVLAQRKALEISRQSLIIARNDRLWDLRVTGAISHERGHDALVGSAGSSTNKSIGVQLGIPILGDYSGRQGEIQATTSLRTAEIAYDGLLQSVELQIRDAVQVVETGWLQLEAARRARALAARALDLQQEKLKAGRASNFEVLSFQADLRSADTQQLAAEIAYLNALTGLDQQIGNTLDTWRISLND
ncbi:TolC family protein [Sphingomonas sp. KC8]|uniref:TolC family protein n=1 Tax=Sphingomonas sp. KC8 TaxID=1030157 RepID=UPI000A31E374|nr:TolC family protein [Sphingomonas sp. KC8]ARS29264.1 transporter [Sphingomonas sp. KC8]